jgi:hypothetical protein
MLAVAFIEGRISSDGFERLSCAFRISLREGREKSDLEGPTRRSCRKGREFQLAVPFGEIEAFVARHIIYAHC